MRVSANRVVLVAAGLLAVLAGLDQRMWAQDVVLLDEVVARVNQEVITLTDLNREERILRAGIQERVQDPEAREAQFQQQRRTLLSTLIQNKMLVQRAEEFGMTSEVDQDVVATVERMMEESGIPSAEVLDQYLRQQGSSLDEYRQSLRERMIIDSLIQQFVYSRITLLTPEIEQYYREHIDRFTQPARVALKEILLLSEGKGEGELEAKADELLSQLKGGASFEDLARLHSEGHTAQRGGDIGEFARGAMASEIEEAVFELNEGEISDLIRTEYGLLIMKVVTKTPPVQQPLEAVRGQISQELYRIKAQPQMKEFIDEVRQQTYIYVAPRYREMYDVSELGRVD